MRHSILFLVSLFLLGCDKQEVVAPKPLPTVFPIPVNQPEEIPEVKKSPFIFIDGRITELPEQKELPKKAYEHLPQISKVIKDLEYPIYYPQHIAGLIEQESCITLKHSRCWSPTAELKTSREYGFGLGQITIAYREDGTERFNVFEELKAQAGFENWNWNDRFNPYYQIRGVVVKLRNTENILKFEKANPYEAIAFNLAAYNGGTGHVIKDRILCLNRDNCDPSKWFDNVELDSVKSKRKLAAYGNRSLFEINRSYAPKVLEERMHKYTWYLQSLLVEE